LRPREETTCSLETRPVIWIIGNNVLMDGVTGCLQDGLAADLVRWEDLKFDVDRNLPESNPSLIIFELDHPGLHTLLHLLREQPGIHLLGINQNCNQVIVLNSFTRKTSKMTDLYQIVEKLLSDRE
jgi:hypothetical protein